MGLSTCRHLHTKHTAHRRIYVNGYMKIPDFRAHRYPVNRPLHCDRDYHSCLWPRLIKSLSADELSGHSGNGRLPHSRLNTVAEVATEGSLYFVNTETFLSGTVVNLETITSVSRQSFSRYKSFFQTFFQSRSIHLCLKTAITQIESRHNYTPCFISATVWRHKLHNWYLYSGPNSINTGIMLYLTKISN